jgi:hypothetical protein
MKSLSQQLLLYPDHLFRLTSEPRQGRFSHFQFEFRWFAPGSSDITRPNLRLICEANGEDVAMLVTNAHGMPYALLAGDGAWTLDSDNGGAVIHIPRLKMNFDLPHQDVFPTMRLSTDRSKSKCRLDLAAVINELLKEDLGCVYSPMNSTFNLTKEGRSGPMIRMNRERSKWSFGIAEVTVRNRAGEGYDITNIQAGPRIIRSILSMDETLKKEFAGSIREVKPTGQLVDELFPLAQPLTVEKKFDDPQVRQTGLKWLSAILTADPKLHSGLENTLTTLTNGLNNNEVSTARLDDLVDRLHAHLYEDVDRKLRKVVEDLDYTLMAGLDPTATRAHMECLHGHKLQMGTSAALAEAMVSPHLSPKGRLQAADALGLCGLENAEIQIAKLRERIKQIDDPSLPNILATIAVRNAVATNEDVLHLRDGIVNDKSSLPMRLYCLESLFLADGAEGLDNESADVWKLAYSRPDLQERCYFAAPCSKEGRAILIDELTRLVDDGTARDQVLPLSVLIGRVRSTDPEFGELMPLAKRYALNTSHDPIVQYFAARVAALDLNDDEYRHQFVSSALASKNVVLINCGVFQYLLLLQERPYRYFDALAVAFDTAPAKLRGQILTILKARFKEPIPEEHRAAFDRFITKAKGDANPTVRLLAQQFEQQQRNVANRHTEAPAEIR